MILLLDINTAGEQEDDKPISTEILHKAHQSRKSAEHIAKQVLHRLDRSCSMQVQLPGACTASPWEDLSSNSRTTRWVFIASNNQHAIFFMFLMFSLFYETVLLLLSPAPPVQQPAVQIQNSPKLTSRNFATTSSS